MGGDGHASGNAASPRPVPFTQAFHRTATGNRPPLPRHRPHAEVIAATAPLITSPMFAHPKCSWSKGDQKVHTYCIKGIVPS